MDATSYARLPPDSLATAAFQVTNQGSATAYVTACDNRPTPVVQRWTGATWEDYTSDACLAIYSMAPVPLTPGQSATGAWHWDVTGTYRIRLHYGETALQPFAHTATGLQFDLQ